MSDNSCLKYIDTILYINLEHRKDRNEHCLNEIKKIDPNLSKTHRIDAVYNPENGALGCTQSHIKALKYFIENPSWNTCLILEDDFTFKSENPEEVNGIVSYLIQNSPNFNVLLLGISLFDLKYIPTENPLIFKITSAQTTSGYIITRNYVYTLLANFIKANNNMVCNGWKPEWCLDMFWKQLMPIGNWYGHKYRIGYQYGNYSDIEKGYRDFGC